jgi:hypothetical protein
MKMNKKEHLIRLEPHVVIVAFGGDYTDKPVNTSSGHQCIGNGCFDESQS